MKKTIMVTGGSGFIGSAFSRLILRERPQWRVINVDKETDACRHETILPLLENPNYVFYRYDILDKENIEMVFKKEKIDIVVNFAAESSVDRSIISSQEFLRTNVDGVGILLDCCRKFHIPHFHQVSTDEVYGDLPLNETHAFDEVSTLKPSNPYAASKAAAELLALAYRRTYGMKVTISRSSNNYGPYQNPEKLIPLIIRNLSKGRKVPVYGTGKNLRDYIYVEDNCKGILSIIEKGKNGEIYNLASNHEESVLDVIYSITNRMGIQDSQIEFVGDRPGHDRKYTMKINKATSELDFHVSTKFNDGLQKTINWYLSSEGRKWLDLF
jgi:dTDP-glucose 4,6-dehydratase